MFLQSPRPWVLVTSTAVVATRTTAGVDIVAVGQWLGGRIELVRVVSAHFVGSLWDVFKGLLVKLDARTENGRGGWSWFARFFRVSRAFVMLIATDSSNCLLVVSLFNELQLLCLEFGL